jgi:hypothetical protein
MTSAQVVLIIVVLILAVAAGVAAWYFWRQRSLRNQFGPEYDRVVADQDSRLAADRELRARQRRHDELELRPLDEEDRARFAEEWQRVQEQFIEDPANAVVSGEHLVNKLMAQRGYPKGNYDERLAVLSVEHGQTLDHYREAHDMYLRAQGGEADTEELRQALVHYREIFGELLSEGTSRMDGQRARTERPATRMDRKDMRTDEPASHQR